MAGPSQQVEEALATVRECESSLKAARADLHAAFVADLRAGVPQADLARATGYSRERLRQLARDAGIGPRSAPRKRKR